MFYQWCFPIIVCVFECVQYICVCMISAVSMVLPRHCVCVCVRYVAANQEMFTVEYDAAPQEYHRRMI